MTYNLVYLLTLSLLSLAAREFSGVDAYLRRLDQPKSSFASSPLASLAESLRVQYDPSLEVQILPAPMKAKRPLAYSVEMGDPQFLQPRTRQGEEFLLKRLVGSKILLFGEHSQSKEAKDVALQIQLLDRMLKIKPKQQMIIASQALPQSERVDQALRDFVQSKQSSEQNEQEEERALSQLKQIISQEISGASLSPEAEASRLSEIEGMFPLYRWARDHSFVILSLDLPLPLQQAIREQGLSAVSATDRERFLKDPTGFVAAVTNPAYPTYTNEILKEEYLRESSRSATKSEDEADQKIFENFVSAKMLQHEAMASRLFSVLLSSSSTGSSRSNSAERDSPGAGSPGEGPLVVAALHEEDAIFHYGVEERLKRLRALRFHPEEYRKRFFYDKVNQLIAAREESERSGGAPIEIPDEIRVTGRFSSEEDIYSILLNPTPADSCSKTAGLRLGLAFDDDFVNDRSLADFVWFSESPLVKILTRPQNPISREGQRPEGETSILGVF